VFYVVASLLILLGAGLNADFLWNFADLTMGLMTIINVPVIIILGKYAFRALKDYFRQKKQGDDPVFYSENVGLPNLTDYWNKEN